MTGNQPRYPAIGGLLIAQRSCKIFDYLPRRWAVLLCKAPDVFYKLCLVALVQETLILVGIRDSLSTTLVVG